MNIKEIVEKMKKHEVELNLGDVNKDELLNELTQLNEDVLNSIFVFYACKENIEIVKLLLPIIDDVAANTVVSYRVKFVTKKVWKEIITLLMPKLDMDRLGEFLFYKYAENGDIDMIRLLSDNGFVIDKKLYNKVSSCAPNWKNISSAKDWITLGLELGLNTKHLINIVIMLENKELFLFALDKKIAFNNFDLDIISKFAVYDDESDELFKAMINSGNKNIKSYILDYAGVKLEFLLRNERVFIINTLIKENKIATTSIMDLKSSYLWKEIIHLIDLGGVEESLIGTLTAECYSNYNNLNNLKSLIKRLPKNEMNDKLYSELLDKSILSHHFEKVKIIIENYKMENKPVIKRCYDKEIYSYLINNKFIVNELFGDCPF